MTETTKNNQPELMQGRVAVVTGASRGLGAAIARLLAEQGAAVGVNYRSGRDEAQQLVDEIVAAGGSAIALQADVRDKDQVDAMMQKAEEMLGPIDTLVLNTTVPFQVVPIAEQSWANFDSKLIGELKAAFYPCKAVIPAMIRQQSGCIIAISSMASQPPDEGFAACTTAKAAVDGFVKSLAKELGPKGIRVNAIALGETLIEPATLQPKAWIDILSEQAPPRRNAQPEDVADAVLLLASERARFITGAYLKVNGGIEML